MGAGAHVITGERHTVRFALEKSLTGGELLIQPPVNFSKQMLEFSGEDEGIEIEETVSSTYGTLLHFELTPGWLDDICDTEDTRENRRGQRAVEAVTNVGTFLLEHADATASSKLFNELYCVKEATDGN